MNRLPQQKANRWTTPWWVLVLGIVGAPSSPVLVPAAPPSQEILDPAAAGVEYRLQGEYTGLVSTAQGQRRLGVQVVARGKGEFLVVFYRGGLPGSGAVPGSRTPLQAKREGNMLLIRHGPWLALALAGQMRLYDSQDGILRGVLLRVHRRSPTLGMAPPPGAWVLFDGSSLKHWHNGRLSPQGWLCQGAETAQPLPNDFWLHVEFRLPFMPQARGQARANSGVYLHRRYEVQILDSFGLEPRDNGCGALYRYRAPDVNACLPPLVWQTYDIWFHSPRWSPDGGRKLQAARITVRLNGVLIHNQVELVRKTGAGRPEGPQPLPLWLQDHGNQVRFRNIWLLPLKGLPPALAQQGKK